MIPGEVIAADGEIELNAGRETVTLSVANTGDRPIQARGCRLNIPAGTAVRFEPGQTREIELVAYAGDRHVYGFRGQVMGALDGGDDQ